MTTQHSNFYDFLEPVTNIFDWLHHSWEAPRAQYHLSFALLWVYLFALGGVELGRRGLFPLWLPQPPSSHFYAIHLAFTLILVMEVMGLIFAIPSSVSKSMGKQFEILTLILLRNAFKELENLPEPVSIDTGNIGSVVDIAVSALGSLGIFLCLGLYRSICRRHKFLQNGQMRMRYVMSKKLLALALFIFFLCLGVRALYIYFTTAAEPAFFETIYTILIFADIAMLLISQRYMPGYYAVFRYSGYVIGTLLMRLALSSPPLWSPAIGLFAALFVLALTWGSNRFSPSVETKAQIQPRP